MAWDEWEQLKTAAVERHSAQMQLNQLPADQQASGSDGSGGRGGPWDSGGGSGTLRSVKAAWTKAGEGVGSLRESISQALANLEEGQKGLGKDLGCMTAAAQRDVYESWQRYVKRVSGRCGALAEILEKTGNDQLKTDEAVKAEIAKLKTEYEDTPALGGQAKGR
ncbi:hypothetical protein K4749_25325 [Streptomyces sp. TRM72054]|uniref:hypothetical protein n=1 Tax=Streptomyces sp. TRM72054 TaxID=2870562 RepID=UPI001C8B292B|nr:hypothetical protein [Streptomyces sp. TRM72054]MBX9396817.1 hypothetical protein [Streptomyces sp. TRM72054]